MTSPPLPLTDVAAHLAGLVKHATLPTLVPPILVPMVASAQPLTQHSFARVHQPSTAKPANKTSMNVPRLPLPVRMVVCV